MSVTVGHIADLRKHLGYDPDDAKQRIERAARSAERQAALTRLPMRPPYPTVRVFGYELPKFVRDRADAKGIDL